MGSESRRSREKSCAAPFEAHPPRSQWPGHLPGYVFQLQPHCFGVKGQPAALANVVVIIIIIIIIKIGMCFKIILSRARNGSYHSISLRYTVHYDIFERLKICNVIGVL